MERDSVPKQVHSIYPLSSAALGQLGDENRRQVSENSKDVRAEEAKGIRGVYRDAIMASDNPDMPDDIYVHEGPPTVQGGEVADFVEMTGMLRLRRQLRRRFRFLTADEADDLLQQVIVALIACDRTWPDSVHFEDMINQAAWSIWSNGKKKLRNKDLTKLRVEKEAEQWHWHPAAPDAGVEHADRMLALRKKIEVHFIQYPVCHRVLSALFLRGLTPHQVCESFHLTPTQYKSTLKQIWRVLERRGSTDG